MLDELRKHEIEYFNLGSTNKERFPGPYRFKYQLGYKNSLYSSIGEWNYTNSLVLEKFLNFLIKIYFNSSSLIRVILRIFKLMKAIIFSEIDPFNLNKYDKIYEFHKWNFNEDNPKGRSFDLLNLSKEDFFSEKARKKLETIYEELLYKISLKLNKFHHKSFLQKHGKSL